MLDGGGAIVLGALVIVGATQGELGLMAVGIGTALIAKTAQVQRMSGGRKTTLGTMRAIAEYTFRTARKLFGADKPATRDAEAEYKRTDSELEKAVKLERWGEDQFGNATGLATFLCPPIGLLYAAIVWFVRGKPKPAQTE